MEGSVVRLVGGVLGQRSPIQESLHLLTFAACELSVSGCVVTQHDLMGVLEQLLQAVVLSSMY